MSVTHALLAGAALVAVALPGSASAQDYGAAPDPNVPLPPVSGTIRLPFQTAGWHRHITHRHWLRGGYLLPENQAWGSRHYPRVAGYQGGIQGQIWRQTYNTAGAEAFWNRNVEFYGEGNDTLALTTTGWGTADSATTGGSYPPPSPWHRASVPVDRAVAAGSPWSGLAGQSYGVAPTGGLAYYNSGSSGGMSYYSSSSSAGPYGSTGGMAIYSSGSYGPGPKILHVDGRHAERWPPGYGYGPRIIHVGREDSRDQLD